MRILTKNFLQGFTIGIFQYDATTAILDVFDSIVDTS